MIRRTSSNSSFYCVSIHKSLLERRPSGNHHIQPPPISWSTLPAYNLPSQNCVQGCVLLVHFPPTACKFRVIFSSLHFPLLDAFSLCNTQEDFKMLLYTRVIRLFGHFVSCVIAKLYLPYHKVNPNMVWLSWFPSWEWAMAIATRYDDDLARRAAMGANQQME